MGTGERAGDAAAEVETRNKEMVGEGELAQDNTDTCNLIMTLATLPPNVRKRIRGLRLLQKEIFDIKAKFYSEVHELECQYEKLFRPLLEKRAQIVNGEYEPTDEECQNPWCDKEDEELAKAMENEATTEGEKKEGEETKPTEPPMDPNVKGIPDFWLTIFRNEPMLADLMEEYDEPIIKNLQDIKVFLQENPMSFKMEFHFASNDYFENEILTKEYFMNSQLDDMYPLDFEGPEIYSCKGCEIKWKEGKNVTVKTVEKKQKHKSSGLVRTVSKTVHADSFFNFFSEPVLPETTDNPELASEIDKLLSVEFDIDTFIRDRVVPRAVLLYTGEGIEDDDDDNYEEEEYSQSDEDSGTEEVSEYED